MEKDVFYDEVKSFVIEENKATVASIQRRFRIGYERSAAIMEMLVKNEVVTEPLENGTRKVLFKKVDLLVSSTRK